MALSLSLSQHRRSIPCAPCIISSARLFESDLPAGVVYFLKSVASGHWFATEYWYRMIVSKSGSHHDCARYHAEPIAGTESRNRPRKRFLLQPGGLPSRSGDDLVQRLAVRGARMRSAESWQRLYRANRRISRSVPERSRRRFTRLPQYLPASWFTNFFFNETAPT